MKKLFIVIIVMFAVSTTLHAQKSIEGATSTLELYPLKISVEIKKDKTYHFLLTKTEEYYKLLVTEDESIMSALRSQETAKKHTFESVKFQAKVAKKLYKKASDNSDLDLSLVSPYEVYLIFNTSIKPGAEKK